jgi:hypothetical protein
LRSSGCALQARHSFIMFNEESLALFDATIISRTERHVIHCLMAYGFDRKQQIQQCAHLHSGSSPSNISAIIVLVVYFVYICFSFDLHVNWLYFWWRGIIDFSNP